MQRLILFRASLLAGLAMTLATTATVSASEPVHFSGLDAGKRFDFLIGDWDYSFAGGCGHSRYWHGAEGKSVLEHLTPGYVGPQPFSGFSVLVHNADNAQWHHNWVDSMGNVLIGSGALVADHPAYDQPVMETEFTFQNRTFRHVWRDVEATEFFTDLWIDQPAQNDDADSYPFQMIRTIRFWRSDASRSFEDNCEDIVAPQN